MPKYMFITSYAPEGASGAVRCRTVPLVSVEEIDAAAKKSLDYRKPGG